MIKMYTLTYIQAVRILFNFLTFLKSLNIQFSWKGAPPPQIYRNNIPLSYMIIQLYDCYNVDYKGSGCL